jgi:MinD superfamily P-loop ATPase
MVIVVASGKGGTGKTTVATNLALYLSPGYNLSFMDLDVEEPNAHIFLKPREAKDTPVNKKIPRINYDKCTFCGLCADICVYNALAVLKNKVNEVMVFPEMCHSCGACMELCPEDAISEIDYKIGHIKFADLPGIRFYEGNLNVGELAAPEVIAQVKKYINHEDLTIMDAPPGSSCSVVESVKNVDFCILVTEPTPFGLSDLKIMVDLLKKLSIPTGIIINQYEEGQTLIEDYAREKNVPILARIPFDREIAHYYSTGIPFITSMPGYKDIFAGIIPEIKELVAK